MDMTMSSARPNRVEVVTSVQRRRCWTPEQKLAIVKQTNKLGSSVSLVAREHGLTAAQLFQWRKAFSQVIRRESVTTAAGNLEATGLISYVCGHIKALNRPGA